MNKLSKESKAVYTKGLLVIRIGKLYINVGWVLKEYYKIADVVRDIKKLI